VTAGALLFSLASSGTPAAASDPVFSALCFGAASAEPGTWCTQPSEGPVVPRPEDAFSDRSLAYESDCQVNIDFTNRWQCEFGDLESAVNVALVGNSHAIQWIPALDELGRRHGFKVTTFVAARCFATTTRQHFTTDGLEDNCHAWGRWARETVAKGDFDLIVQTERTFGRPGGAEVPEDEIDDVFQAGYVKHLKRWVDADRTVLVIRDTPLPAEDVPLCLLRNPDDYAKCSGSVNDLLQRDPLAEAARTFDSPRVRVADMTNYFCPQGQCLGAIGRIVVYRDNSHVTATYARSVAPYLEGHLLDALQVADAGAGSKPKLTVRQKP
jgi:hypothetical protein